METWMITGVTGFLGSRVEMTLREKGEVEVLPMTREELNFTDEEQVKRVLGTLHPDVLVHAAAVSSMISSRSSFTETCSALLFNTWIKFTKGSTFM